MTVVVRPAGPADRAGCLALIESLVGEPATTAWSGVYDALLEGTRGDVLVAEEEGVLLGTATVSYNLAIRYSGEYAQLEELIVGPEARGKNAGGLLVEATVRRARERGCAEMGLYLVAQTEKNQSFYAKYGFERVGSEMRQPL